MTLDIEGFEDADFAVDGSITIENPSPFSAVITGVTDVLSFNDSGTSVAAVITAGCGSGESFALAPGATETCDDTASVGDVNPGPGVNTEDVQTDPSGFVGGATAAVPVAFGEPTTRLDECVTAADTRMEGTLGMACVDDAPKTLRYTLTIGPFNSCGQLEFENTASFTTSNTRRTGLDTHVLDITVPCGDGCTLTQGYWKTHSERGPAPYDATWALLGAGGAATPFFRSGKTYYEVLWTAPRGNPYYTLAHPYIAAVLSGLGGANKSAIVNEMQQATMLFSRYRPEDLTTKSLRQTFYSLATTLDSYNNGHIGPGHCSESPF